MPPKSQPVTIQALIDLTIKHQNLLAQFLTSVTDVSSSKTATNTPTTSRASTASLENAPNPLNVLRDASTLLKAHTTKLSLLILNKPFTPKSISEELKKAVEECVVCMVSAMEIMGAPTNTNNSKETQGGGEDGEGLAWGVTMLKESRVRVARVIREVSVLVEEVRSVAEAAEEKNRSKATSKSSQAPGPKRDTLSSTGVVWEACDNLIELSRLNIAGLAVQKAQQYRDTLMDAITELKEWADEEEEQDDSEEEEDGHEDDGVNDEFDDMFAAANAFPKNDAGLRAQLDSSVKTLKSIGVLYQALVKRRLKTFEQVVTHAAKTNPNPNPKSTSTSTSNIKTLDSLLTTLQTIPETVDDLASSFYDLDAAEASKLLDECTALAIGAADLARRNWQGEEDEFTAWSAKWKEAVSGSASR